MAMAEMRGRLALLLALSSFCTAQWTPLSRVGSATPSVRFEYRYATQVLDCDNRCGAGNGTAQSVCSQFRTDLENNGEQVFVRHVANPRPCRSKGLPARPTKAKCWGTEPATTFCTRCGAAGGCDECAPGFRMVGAECKNVDLQVLMDITAPGHLYHEWQLRYQPQLQRCLGDILARFGAAGADDKEPAISVHSVLDIDDVRPKRDNILIRSTFSVPLGLSAGALATWLKTEVNLKSMSDDCPTIANLERVSVLCPGAIPALPDSTCPTDSGGWRLTLLYWDCVGLGGIAVAVVIFCWLERRRRARDRTFADSATKQARRMASGVEAQQLREM
mmetsp:Transcript_130652/g.377941  ORF Transcript_130652/g.377941 Transcript_130652/m.377941 type:complete len:333 (+) Transcript_130652:208-1206(+)